MLLLTAAAIAASAPPDLRRPPQGPAVQARATVRIVRGARVQLGQRDSEAPPARAARIQTASGPQPAQLIEFE